MAAETMGFRAWLGDQIREVLSRKQPQPPFLVWYDPERVWARREVGAGSPWGANPPGRPGPWPADPLACYRAWFGSRPG